MGTPTLLVAFDYLELLAEVKSESGTCGRVWARPSRRSRWRVPPTTFHRSAERTRSIVYLKQGVSCNARQSILIGASSGRRALSASREEMLMSRPRFAGTTSPPFFRAPSCCRGQRWQRAARQLRRAHAWEKSSYLPPVGTDGTTFRSVGLASALQPIEARSPRR